jgi:hypothetical protein
VLSVAVPSRNCKDSDVKITGLHSAIRDLEFRFALTAMNENVDWND